LSLLNLDQVTVKSSSKGKVLKYFEQAEETIAESEHYSVGLESKSKRIFFVGELVKSIRACARRTLIVPANGGVRHVPSGGGSRDSCVHIVRSVRAVTTQAAEVDVILDVNGVLRVFGERHLVSWGWTGGGEGTLC
jgi:hypothetical protein